MLPSDNFVSTSDCLDASNCSCEENVSLRRQDDLSEKHGFPSFSVTIEDACQDYHFTSIGLF